MEIDAPDSPYTRFPRERYSVHVIVNPVPRRDQLGEMRLESSSELCTAAIVGQRDDRQRQEFTLPERHLNLSSQVKERRGPGLWKTPGTHGEDHLTALSSKPLAGFYSTHLAPPCLKLGRQPKKSDPL